MMNKVQRNRVKKLADFLLAFKPTTDRKFNIHTFIQRKGCGTTACALGWCPEVFPRSGWKYNYDDDSLYYNNGRASIGTLDYFGISFNESPFAEEYWAGPAPDSLFNGVPADGYKWLAKLKRVTARRVGKALYKEYLTT